MIDYITDNAHTLFVSQIQAWTWSPLGSQLAQAICFWVSMMILLNIIPIELKQSE